MSTPSPAASEGAAARSALPRIAIVGRPNVGKSTLLNRMCGSRVSIVEPTAGVTRDRIAVPARLTSAGVERWVEVIDTGGIGIVDRHDLGPHVEEQVRLALAGAELVLFLVDARDGLTPLDREVARRLRGATTPVLLVVNKIESKASSWEVDDFRRLGMDDGPWPISALEGAGIDALTARIFEQLPPAAPDAGEGPPRDKAVMKLAVVGRRNAGKSTLINAFAHEERMIVSEIPGTTRDAVDVLFDRGGETFIAIDTAGLRKRSKLADAIEFFSEARARRSIRRADVVVLLYDASLEISAIEKTLGRFVIDRYKPVVLAGNKWDLVGDEHRKAFHEYLDKEIGGLKFAPRVFLSAKEGRGVDDVLDTARRLFEQAKTRVGTGDLNRVFEQALIARSPSSRGHRIRLKYATQAEVSPPTFVVFLNDTRLVTKAYLRYLQNRIREDLPFPEVPIRIVLRDKDSGDEEGDRD